MSKIILSEKQIGNINIRYSVSKAEPCILNALIINGVSTSVFTFGKIKDISPMNAPKNYFGCVKRRFLPYSLIPEADLKPLGITRDDIPTINSFLKKLIDRDNCSECFKKIKG